MVLSVVDIVAMGLYPFSGGCLAKKEHFFVGMAFLLLCSVFVYCLGKYFLFSSLGTSLNPVGEFI